MQHLVSILATGYWWYTRYNSARVGSSPWSASVLSDYGLSTAAADGCPNGEQNWTSIDRLSSWNGAYPPLTKCYRTVEPVMGFRECDRACSSHGGSMLCVESRYESQALAMFLQVSNRLNGNRRCSINTGGAGCAWIGLYESNDTATNSSADTWRWNAPGCTSTYRGYGFATMSNGFATMSNQGWGMWRDEVAEAQNTCICQSMLPSPPPSQPPPPSPPPWPPTPPPPTPPPLPPPPWMEVYGPSTFTAAALVSLLVPCCLVLGLGSIFRRWRRATFLAQQLLIEAELNELAAVEEKAIEAAIRKLPKRIYGSSNGHCGAMSPARLSTAMEDEEGTEMEDFSSGSSRATTPSWVSCRVGAASESAPPSSRGEKSDRSDGSDNSSFGQPMSSVRNLLGMPPNPARIMPEGMITPPRTPPGEHEGHPEVDVEATPAANEVGGGPSSSSSTLDECAVCLTEFEEGDEVRVLPCGHIFHLDCCDKWLLSSGRGPGEEEQTLAERASNCTLLQQRPLPSCPLCKTIALVPCVNSAS